MKDNIFMTADRVPGHLEYSGNPIVTKDSREAKVCHRWEVRETREGFRLNDVTFTKSRGQLAWHEVMRQEWDTYESKLGAIEAVKVQEKSYWEAVADDLAEQCDRERIEAGWELDRISRDLVPGRAPRGIVDMGHDDGLTPKQALEVEKQTRGLKPIGFLGKNILAVEADPIIADSKAYRQELADEFRKAVEALPPMPEKTCDWCGIDILPDARCYPMVHDEFMCRKCYEEYSR
jgi:hypothetical protein